jgi:hypothetical protein
VAKDFNDDFNTESLTLTHIFLGNDTCVPVNDITVKQLQTLLKTALSKTSKAEFEIKMGISTEGGERERETDRQTDRERETERQRFADRGSPTEVCQRSV